MSGMLATILIDYLISLTAAYTHLERLGYILTLSTCLPYALSIICFQRAGKHYSDFKRCLYYCKSATLEKVKIEDYVGHRVVKRDTEHVSVRKKASFIL